MSLEGEISRAAQFRRDAHALRQIADRAGDTDHLLDARAGRLAQEADAIWPSSIGDSFGERGQYEAWSWSVSAASTEKGLSIDVAYVEEGRGSTVRIRAQHAEEVARAILEIVEHSAIENYLAPAPATCAEPGCDLPTGHAGDHDTIPF